MRGDELQSIEGSQRDVLSVDLVGAEVEALQFQPSDLAIAEDSPVRDSQFMEPNSGNQMPADDSRKRGGQSKENEPGGGIAQGSCEGEGEPAKEERQEQQNGDDTDIRTIGLQERT